MLTSSFRDRLRSVLKYCEQSPNHPASIVLARSAGLPASPSTAPPEKAKDEFDPIALEEVKCIPSGFTKWDTTMVDKGDLTLAEFLKAFKEITGETRRPCEVMALPSWRKGVGEGGGALRGVAMCYVSVSCFCGRADSS